MDKLKYFPRENKHVVHFILAVHLLLSLFWLISQGGFFLTKDSFFYLAFASRAAELPLGANFFDIIPASSFLYVNTVPYVYFLTFLNKLPGGFFPYHFFLSQLMHFFFVVALYYAARLWLSKRNGLIVATLCMLEPFHWYEVLSLKQSLFTQTNIGIAVVLAFLAWKKERPPYLLYAALILGLGSLFRSLNLFFFPVILLFVFLTGKSWRARAAYASGIIILVGMFSIPNYLYFRANPQLGVSSIDKLSIMFLIRFSHMGYLNSEHLPRTMERLYQLTPELRDPEVIRAIEGTSIPDFHAFRHSRIYRHGDTPAQAMAYQGELGKIAISEAPFGYIKWGLIAFVQHLGVGYNPRRYNLPLRVPAPPGKKNDVLIPGWGNKMMVSLGRSNPGEKLDPSSYPEYISESFIQCLGNMPRPDRLSFFIAQAWNTLSPFRGMFLMLVLGSSYFYLALRKKGELMLLSGSVISVYFIIVAYLAAMTTSKFVMFVPWILWTAGIAFFLWKNEISSPDEEKEEYVIK